ncbi:MAG TPA: hypothetical protein PLD62_06470 [Candidatus Cloacimonadota bacterium]|nr:hypothetical protein [Candidatus Cloacimonadota bacterium]
MISLLLKSEIFNHKSKIISKIDSYLLKVTKSATGGRVFKSHFSPLISHFSPLTSHFSPLTSHFSLLTSHPISPGG